MEAESEENAEEERLIKRPLYVFSGPRTLQDMPRYWSSPAPPITPLQLSTDSISCFNPTNEGSREG